MVTRGYSEKNRVLHRRSRAYDRDLKITTASVKIVELKHFAIPCPPTILFCQVGSETPKQQFEGRMSRERFRSEYLCTVPRNFVTDCGSDALSFC